ncbi:NAD(P)-dependent oxidoreductase [Jannaschia aquimarina]|uniref:NAD(P)-binding domain-containing protein n=1 Tax=Jannaschia aquimarina TaxID=935700 RepID=A0A0D1CQ75_9RHOB|nr:NAD(P)-binding oxidoreductase [Jannaschia aquimarina]KIT16902.1 hypothetical protein jaqu_14010 [Jannaschia aquimarina]SNT11960.1 Putative NADH-flavin reductase [Jannaschia aquimarina]
MTAPILVMGATSGIGRLTVDEATGRGLPVRAFAHSAGDLSATDLLEPCPGDARDADDVRKGLAGCRAVIYALGITERLSMLWEEETLFSDTTRVLLPAMEEAGVTRLVAVTGFGAGRSKQAMSTLERMGHRAILGRPYADKDRQEEMIMESALDWTIVRPVILTNGKGGAPIKVLRDPATWRNGLIPRTDVARHLVDTVEQGLDVKADVVISR